MAAGEEVPQDRPSKFSEILDAESAVIDRAEGEPLSALCLSGGGIRSAALCLGVMQALAVRRLLGRFHYLSTVSGGGYIGGFVTACIAAQAEAMARNPHGPQVDPVAAVEDMLAGRTAQEELRGLRRFTNYLTPHPGLASADTWAGITLWARNTGVNWLVFTPLALALAAAPLFYLSVVGIAAALQPRGYVLGLAFGLAALMCLALCMADTIIALPSHQHPDREEGRAEPRGYGTRHVMWRIVLVAAGWSILAPLSVAHALHLPEGGTAARTAFWALVPRQRVEATPWIYALPGVAFVAAFVAFFYAEWAVDVTYAVGRRPSGFRAIGAFLSDTLCRRRPRRSKDKSPETRKDRRRHRLAFAKNRVAWGLSAAAASGFLALGLWLANGASALWLALAGPLWIIVGETVRISLYVALRRDPIRGDLDREWLARLNGIQVFGALALCVVGIASAFLSTLAAVEGQALWAAIVGGGLASGSLTATVGRSALTAFAQGGEQAKPRRFLRAETLLGVGVALFATALLTVAGALVKQVALGPTDLGAGWRTAVLVSAILVSIPIAGVCLYVALFNLPAWSQVIDESRDKEDVVLTAYRRRGLSAALGLFGAVLFVLCPILVEQGWRVPPSDPLPPVVQYYLAGFSCALVAFLATGLATFLGGRIDLNAFSMHAVYRNRLVRAFLGTARPQSERRIDRFTQFDPADDRRMALTLAKDAGGAYARRRLFPVINVALNRTSGKDTARAERKAEPFTITPLHCGAATLFQPSQAKGEGDSLGAYVPTVRYAGAGQETGPADDQKGITLGTAMTLSGAAASPNMGYHSSPSVAFLMTLFNVRLGGWLPNPRANPRTQTDHAGPSGLADILPRAFVGLAERFRDTRRDPADAGTNRSGPENGLPTLLSELAGRSDEDSAFVYLSDGGHVDNLGLTEMLRRRCRYIVAVDAGEDGSYAYFDLGTALQHARIDLGVEVTFFMPLSPRDKTLPAGGAYATIRYPARTIHGIAHAEEVGQLLFLKSWLPGNAPTDLRAFQALKDNFPHASTVGEQFFTESDFESYRRLGQFLVEEVFRHAETPQPPRPAIATVPDLIAAVSRAASAEQTRLKAAEAQAKRMANPARAANRRKRP